MGQVNYELRNKHCDPLKAALSSSLSVNALLHPFESATSESSEIGDKLRFGLAPVSGNLADANCNNRSSMKMIVGIRGF